jgi:hypothetical protein
MTRSFGGRPKQLKERDDHIIVFEKQSYTQFGEECKRLGISTAQGIRQLVDDHLNEKQEKQQQLEQHEKDKSLSIFGYKLGNTNNDMAYAIGDTFELPMDKRTPTELSLEEMRTSLDMAIKALDGLPNGITERQFKLMVRTTLERLLKEIRHKENEEYNKRNNLKGFVQTIAEKRDVELKQVVERARTQRDAMEGVNTTTTTETMLDKAI